MFFCSEREQVNERPSRTLDWFLLSNNRLSEPNVLDVESVFKVNENDKKNWVEGIIEQREGYGVLNN